MQPRLADGLFQGVPRADIQRAELVGKAADVVLQLGARGDHGQGCRCLDRRQRCAGHLAHGHRARHVDTQQGALEGRLDIGESRVEGLLQRLDDLRHHLPLQAAAQAMALLV